MGFNLLFLYGVSQKFLNFVSMNKHQKFLLILLRPFFRDSFRNVCGDSLGNAYFWAFLLAYIKKFEITAEHTSDFQIISDNSSRYYFRKQFGEFFFHFVWWHKTFFPLLSDYDERSVRYKTILKNLLKTPLEVVLPGVLLNILQKCLQKCIQGFIQDLLQ